MITATTITDVRAWADEAPQFDQLAGTYFTRSYNWLRSWWDCYQTSDKQLYILRAQEDDRVIGYLPLYLQNDPIRGRLLSFIGSGKACSDDMQLQTAAVHRPDVSRAIAEHLHATGSAGEWDYLQLEGVRMASPTMRSFLQNLRHYFDGSLSELRDQNCWSIPLPGTWEEYLQARSTKYRAHFRKLDRQYFQTGRAQVQFASDYEEAKRQLTFITEMHDQRWKSKGTASCVAHEGFSNFLSSAFDRMWSQGNWYSMLLEIDGQIASGAIGAKFEKTVCIYLVGMSPKMAEHRPGTLMNLASIQDALAKGFNNFDLMRGDEEYKSKLGAIAVPQYVWQTSAPRFIPRLKGSVLHKSQALKLWLKGTLAPIADASGS